MIRGSHRNSFREKGTHSPGSGRRIQQTVGSGNTVMTSSKDSTLSTGARDVSRLRVAVVGIRGIPAKFGGSETAAEEIGWRMAAAGDHVCVYCRRHNSANLEGDFRGMHRIVLPSINTFQLDTMSHSFLASLHILRTNSADVIHFHGVGNGLVLPLFLLSEKRLIVTIDGPDWERPKWGRLARYALRLGAWLAVHFADALIIDTHPARQLFAERYGVDSEYIPYGADIDKQTAKDFLAQLGLQPNSYILFVGALVPDKGPDLLLDAFASVNTDLPLVIVGDSPFFPRYRAELKRKASDDSRVMMLGYVYGDRYRQLLASAYAYVHPLRSDGTSPALLQAMAYGNCVIVNSVPEALSAVGDAALAYRRNDSNDLAAKLQQVIDQPDMALLLREKAVERVREEYSWERVTEDHRLLFSDVLQGRIARNTRFRLRGGRQ